ncbi:hypothetical protein K8P03_11095 [Anaerococcus murdochii]|uniref:Uncharacterized protein n=1 Tax=Anaerococcus murdochii TaxID=411577 RepID=A0ABS7SW83_9FIRM|nr:hypothetical protein [Anaerococcus murdochii]MBZ2385778.1 hypothetical protein [Anaerococcus murdochii]MBZ2387818.1 hypothetical protein [Anaerococcus murdochii]
MKIKFVQEKEFEVDIDLEDVYKKFDGDVQKAVESGDYEPVYVGNKNLVVFDSDLSHKDVLFRDCLIKEKRREMERARA